MRFLAIVLGAALLACTPPDSGEAADNRVDRSGNGVPALEQIVGDWRVVSIDGEALPEKFPNGKVPTLTLAGDRVGGTLGCNSFGALSLFADGRIATHTWAGTAMYCKGVAEHERALSELFYGFPAVTRTGDRLQIRSDRHEVVLAYLGPASDASFDPAPQTVAGTRWRISYLDSSEANSSPADRVLEFTDTGWRGLASCATLFGTYRREDDRLAVSDDIANTEQNCPPEYAARDDAFAALMRSNPRYLIGPNGELIIAGGGHMLIGSRAE